jgi:hypothetical protein
MTFECPVDGCDGRHGIEYVMCGRCWRIVSRALQSRVYRAWDRRKRFHGDETAVAEHEAAKRDAIAYVERRLAA